MNTAATAGFPCKKLSKEVCELGMEVKMIKPIKTAVKKLSKFSSPLHVSVLHLCVPQIMQA